MNILKAKSLAKDIIKLSNIFGEKEGITGQYRRFKGSKKEIVITSKYKTRIFFYICSKDGLDLKTL